MNAELNNMRCRHATSTADMPPDGRSIRRPLPHIEPFERDRCPAPQHPPPLAYPRVLSLSIEFRSRVFPRTRNTHSRFPSVFPVSHQRAANNRARFTRTRLLVTAKSRRDRGIKIHFSFPSPFSAIPSPLPSPPPPHPHAPRGAIFIAVFASDAQNENNRSGK